MPQQQSRVPMKALFFGFDKPLMRRRRITPLLLSGAFAIDHPGRAEPIGSRAEAEGPEGLSDRHLNNPAFAQIAKDAISFRWIVDLNTHAEALRL